MGKPEFRTAHLDSKRSKDGLAPNCRACVNRRRRELDQQRREQPKPTTVDIIDAARRGKLDVVKAHVFDDPDFLQLNNKRAVAEFLQAELV